MRFDVCTYVCSPRCTTATTFVLNVKEEFYCTLLPLVVLHGVCNVVDPLMSVASDHCLCPMHKQEPPHFLPISLDDRHSLRGQGRTALFLQHAMTDEEEEETAKRRRTRQTEIFRWHSIRGLHNEETSLALKKVSWNRPENGGQRLLKRNCEEEEEDR